MANPVVSIIIPTYNRGHFLGQTLDSILRQTYPNWECIVVDDASTDYTVELMEFYYENDSRIQFHHRPKNKRKGANACRNYGFKKSKGKFIQWFDSDDLMVTEFLEIKVKAIQESGADYVISKAVNFKDPNLEHILSYNENYYRFSEFAINHYNYTTQKINWLTYDFLGKREVVEYISFNERLKSAQERNFFCKLTCFSVNAKILNIYLTKRRIHSTSTQARFKDNKALKQKENLEFLYETWNDLYGKCNNQESLQYLLNNGLLITIENNVNWSNIFQYTKAFTTMHKYKTAFWYLIYQASRKIFKRGHIFRRKFLRLYKVV